MHLPKPFQCLVPTLMLCFCLGYSHGQSSRDKQDQAQKSNIKESSGMVDNLNRIGMRYYMKSLDSCFFYAMKAKTMANKLQYAKGKTDADNVIASALFLRGMYKESLELFSKVLTDYRKQQDTANVTQAVMNTALVYMVLTDTTKAVKLCRNAIQIGKELKQDSIMSLVYANYPSLNTTLSDDSVKYYLDKSTEIATRYKDERMLIAIQQMQASHLFDKGHKQEALVLIKSSLSESQKANLGYLEINSLGLYIAYFANNPDSVLNYLNRSYQIAVKNGYGFMKVSLLKEILTYTKLSGNKDKILNVQHLMETALVTENDNLKKFIGDYIKYNAIQNDNIQLGIANKKNRSLIGLLVTICCITTLLIIFIYRQYQTSRRLNKRIGEQNTQMRKTLGALEQSQADNTRMMKIAAHDLRNPIGGIISVAALMQDDLDRSKDDQMMLELIRTSGQNSLELVNDLLQVHPDAEKLQKESVDLHQMLNYCVELLQHKAEAKMQHISLVAEHVALLVNREKMWRVISNLISNAIKFSPSGTHISVKLEERPEKVIIMVEDHGIGIPMEMKDKIFDMFTEAKRPGTAGEQPFGLGLAISKQIVEAHGGNIWFDSKAGNGTIFFVELPISS